MTMKLNLVISLSQGYTDAQIILALGTRIGTSMQGLDKLHSNTASQPQKQLDPACYWLRCSMHTGVQPSLQSPMSTAEAAWAHSQQPACLPVLFAQY